MIARGEYSSVWDGGKTVTSEVWIDLDEMRITEFGERWMGGTADENDDPDEFEVLEEEFVFIPETDMTYIAVSTDELEWAEDRYGNGIIAY